MKKEIMVRIKDNKLTKIGYYLLLVIAIIAITAGYLTSVLDQKYFNRGIIISIIVFIIVIPLLLLLAFNPIRFKNKKDYIFVIATSVIMIVEIVALILEKIFFFKGDWKGLLSFLALLYIVSPILLLIFIPWIIWFIFQYIKYHNKAITNNAIPLWSILFLLIYFIVHYSIVFW